MMQRFSFFKVYILALFSLCVIDDVDAQIKSTIFYSNNWEITQEENASYYRECSFDTIASNFTGTFNDYTVTHIHIGKGSYRNNSKSGMFQYSYDDGQLYCEGNFVNGNPDSIWNWYYQDGRLMQSICFSDGDFEITGYFDPAGNNCIRAKKFEWLMDVQIDKDSYNTKIIGTYKNNKKQGKWKIVNGKSLVAYDLYKQGIYQESYARSLSLEGRKAVANNLLIPYRTFATEQFYYTGNVSQDEYPWLKNLPEWGTIDGVGIMGDSIIFTEQISPRYLGGITRLRRDIATNIRYPIAEMINNMGGSVLVELIIDENGLIESKNVLKSPGNNFTREALRVIDILDDFKPAIHKGNPIKSRIVIPVSFYNLGIIN